MQTWFITGANRGIGLAVARAALDAGDQVVATARNPGQVEQALPGYGNRLLALRLDVTSVDEAQTAAQQAHARFRRVDILVNNAGYGELGWFENISAEQIRAQFDTNVFGPMHVTRALLPFMRAQRSGHIFMISSVSGISAVAGSSIYSASKFAVEGWMEGLAAEVAPLGISATIVEPGFFKTDFIASSVSFGVHDVEDYRQAASDFEKLHHDINLDRAGDPAKLAAALLTIAAMDRPPARFAAGSDALALVLAKAEAMQAEAKAGAAMSMSTDWSE